MRAILARRLPVLALLMLAACGGGGSQVPRNLPPTQAVITPGVGRASVGQSVDVTCSATDPEGLGLRYIFDWGDGVTEEVAEPVASGLPVTRAHAFGTVGPVAVRCAAREAGGQPGPWSEPAGLAIDPDERLLTVSVEGRGSVSSGTLISCGTSCQARYPSGVDVELESRAAPGWALDGWTGACSGSEPVVLVHIPVGQDVSCTARFRELPARFTLRTVVEGSGQVESLPSGLACPGDCEERFPDGTRVTLRAVAAPGWHLASWSGGCTGEASSLQVVQDRDRTCTASFAQDTALEAGWRLTALPYATSTAWSPNGRWIATLGANDSVLRILDGETGQLLHQLKSDNGNDPLVGPLAWSPSGAVVAVGGKLGSWRAWDAGTGELVRYEWSQSQPVQGLAYSPDGLLVASGDDSGQVLVWDARNPRPEGALTRYAVGARIERMEWSPSGQWMAVQVFQNPLDRIEVRDAATGALAWSRDGASFAWSRAGDVLAVGGTGELTLHTGATGDVTARWSVVQDRALSLAWSVEDRYLAATDEHAHVVVLEAATGTVVGDSSETGRPEAYALTFHPARLELALVSGGIRLYSPVGLAPLRDLTLRRMGSAAWSPDGRLATGNIDGYVHVWSAGGELLSTLEPQSFTPGDSFSLQWDATGAWIAGGTYHQTYVWAVDTGQRREPGWWQGDVVWVLAVAWSPDGRRVATADNTGSVHVWDTQGSPYDPVATFAPDVSAETKALAWSPDGQRLRVGWKDRTWATWEAATGTVVRVTSARAAKELTQAMAFSPDGARVALQGESGGIELRDTASGARLKWLPTLEYTTALAWSPDGQWLASGGTRGQLTLFDPRTGASVVPRVDSHVNTVFALSWRQDGKALLSLGWDDAVMTWRVLP